MKVVKLANKPTDFLGMAIKVFLKAGAKFNFKVTSAGPDYIAGYDDEGMELTIFVADIEFIIG